MSQSRLRLPERWTAFLRSIRFRLTLWFVVILALVVGVFGAITYTLQARDLRRQTLDRIEATIAQIQSIQEVSHADPFERQITIPNISQDAGPLLQSDEILAVTDVQGNVVQKYGPASTSDVNRLTRLGMDRGAGQGPFTYTLLSATNEAAGGPSEYMFVVTPISLGSSVIGFLILGSPVDPTGQLHRYLITLLIGGLGTLALALIGGYWLADRALGPVKEITQTAREIGETDLSRRIALGRQDELGRLADTFDQMLARLQAAFDRQKQFTADASHELRTPLTIVNLETSRALESSRSASEYSRALSVIRSENDFMTRLVNNLLTLSRMDAGQTSLAKEPVDLSDVTLEVAERMQPLAAHQGLDLRTGELPEALVLGDRQYLIQMISNLVENAVKYAGGIGGAICLEVGLEPKSNIGWILVHDDGPGIPAEDLPHVFDRFYQVDRVRSQDHGEGVQAIGPENGASGSGLGLSIVQWIARAHGGDVSVTSEPGKGATFEVKLPLVAAGSG
jgi:signal transduction histidine kinase